MDYELYEGLHRVIGILGALLTGTLALVAVVVAVYCTLKKRRPAAAWIVAVSWVLTFFVMTSYLLGNLLLQRVVGWDVLGWIYLLLDLFALCAGLLMAVGFFLFKPPDPVPDAGQEEVAHG